MDATQIIIEPIVSEKTYVLATAGKYTFRVHDKAHKTQIKQAVEELFDVKVLERRDHVRQGQAQAPRLHGRATAGRGRRPSCRCARATASRSSRAWRPISNADQEGQADLSGSPLRDVLRLRRDHEDHAREVPHRGPASKSGGRNATGRKTARHRGGGAKRAYRKIDFKRTKDGVPAKVASIEYDPNRTAYIALLHYLDGEKRYIVAPNRLRVGMTVESGPGVDITSATRCRWPTSRSAPSSTPSSCSRAVAPSSGAPRASASS